MSDFFYLQRAPRPRQHGRHRRPAGWDKRRAARPAGRALSALSSLPYLATRHLPGLIASAALLAAGVGLSVWAVLS